MDAISLSLLSAFWLVVSILVPGAAFAFCLGARLEHPSASLFLTLGLGTILQPILAIFLDATVGVSTVSLLMAIAGVTVVFIGLGMIRGNDPRTLIPRFAEQWHRIRNPARGWLAMGMGIAAVGSIAAVNWWSAVGVPSSDIGWHAYWAQTIITSGHLPNFLSIEPFDQASKFTFGAGFILAEFQLLTGLHITDFFWVPVLIFSFAELIGLYALVETTTRNRLLGFAVAAIVAGDFLTGGYIQRGNFPDILGYFVVVFILWLLSWIRRFDWRVWALGVSLVALLELHQLAMVVVSLTIVVWASLMILLRLRTSIGMLKAVFVGRVQIAFWGVTALALLLMARRSTYLNGGGVSVLTTSSWAAFVPSLDDYLQFIGLPLVIVGLLGVTAILWRRSPSDLLLMSWIASLVVLANSPKMGLNFEPQRFMWRLPEPLALSTAVGISWYAQRVMKSRLGPNLLSLSKRIPVPWLHPPSSRRIQEVAVGLAAVVIILFAGIGTIQAAPSYSVQMPYAGQDAIIANWLRTNGDANKYVTVNVDSDGSGTWIMALSMLPHFLYKVDFAVVVSPPPYRQVYADLQALYADPGAPGVATIVHEYNIGYVVVDLPNEALFLGTPNFRPAFNAGEMMVFVPTL